MSAEFPPPTEIPPRTTRFGGRRRWSVRKRIFAGVSIAMAAVLLVIAGYSGYVYMQINGIKKSSLLEKVGNKKGNLDLLVMGLDSRLDENGNPLPADIYNALHAGGADVGGLNSNVLMYVHVDANGSRATAISIPRDDYVAFPGCPSGTCHGKIKEAYGLAFAQARKDLADAGQTGPDAYQKARDAARLEEIQTVDEFLGVKINQFAEVTMVAFYQLAQVVQPLTVCVKADTSDVKYSGASFHAGMNQLNSEQMLQFVRQRRDPNNPTFTDLDRERRQQAFIVSLLTKLKSANTLLDPSKVLSMTDVAKKNVVISDGLDPIELAQLADQLASGGIHFYTLPIQSFGTVNGQDVNIVDPAEVKATVASLLAPPATATPSSPSPTPSAPAPSNYTVDVVNGSGVKGAAGTLLNTLAAKGYLRGAALTSATAQSATTVTFNPADRAAAQVLAATVGAGTTLTPDASVAQGKLVVTIGSGASSSAPTVVPGAGDGTTGSGPTVNQLTEISSGGIPCVK